LAPVDSGALVGVKAEVAPSPVRVIQMGEVEPGNAIAMVAALREAIRNDEKVVTISIDSPGGSVGIGLALVSIFTEANRRGIEVRCEVAPYGMAASMAAVFLESPACAHRTIARTAALMFHEPSVQEVGGKEDDLRHLADLLADTNHRMAIIIAARMGIEAEEYERWVKNRDRWLSATEALSRKAVDEIR
jgi:ATP-dependent Clp protease protease subunit